MEKYLIDFFYYKALSKCKEKLLKIYRILITSFSTSELIATRTKILAKSVNIEID